MQLAGIFHGRASQAISRIRRLAKQLVQTRDFATYDPGPLLDTTQVGGMVLIDKEWVPSSQENFHCYLLPESISEASEPSEVRANLHAWLMASLDDEWRFLCTIKGSSWLGLDGHGSEVARRYIRAAIRHWPRIAAEQGRFAPLLEEYDFVAQWSTLGVAFEMLGLSACESLRLQNREPLALLEYVDKRGGGIG